MDEPSIIHVNIVDYASALAQAKDTQLKGRPFVIAAEQASRRIVLSPSQQARKEGISRGMSVLQAQRIVPSLIVLAPDAKLITQANAALQGIVDHYSPSTLNEQGGHLYLDMSGTRRLFGPTVDSALRLKEEIQSQMGVDAAVAVASNKLVAKIGTRAVRPYGMAQIRLDETPSFLAAQEVSLLTGVGPATTSLLKAVGITQIGELARLSDEEVIAFLGPRGIRLRDNARGIDAAPFLPASPTQRT
ncbi:MAG: DNA polymerase, partial [Proteobacteria bacterium]|nr:DNA polymerase [Pseudomonadota bacterium]